MMTGKRIKVLVVDDSAVIRSLLTGILSKDPEIEIVGTAPDPYVARTMLIDHRPDVMTLDIEMPKLDGITFLKAVMEHFPTRTLMISSLTKDGAPMVFRALEAGAVDVMAKPKLGKDVDLDAVAREVTDRVKAVARAKLPDKSTGHGEHVESPAPAAASKVTSIRAAASPAAQDGPAPGIPAMESVARVAPGATRPVVAIVASTGGTEALKAVVPKLPKNMPPIVLLLHMPPMFTKTYAESLQRITPNLIIREAKEGDKLEPGVALLAPGNFHMEIVRKPGGYHVVSLNQQPQVHGVRPAADILMKSVAREAGSMAVGAVLTGMGKDGAAGLLEMRNAGARTFAQDEATSIVFGMPKEAIALGAADTVLPLPRIADAIAAAASLLVTRAAKQGAA